VDGVVDTEVTVETVLRYVSVAEGSLRYRALATNTWRVYKTGLRRWIAFARVRGLNALLPDVETLADCIEHYHDEDIAPTGIDQMCTAVSTVFAWKTGERLGQKEQVSSLIHAIYASKKATPQVRLYFDPEMLLQSLEAGDAASNQLIIHLRKLATLLVLCHAMRFTEMEGIMKAEVVFGEEDSSVEFMITLKTEQRRRRRIVIGRLDERPGVCVVRTMRKVLEVQRTTVPELFSTTEAAGSRRMSAAVISREVKQAMRTAGIAEEVTPYNCKHVGLTKAWEAGASEEQLRDVARWAKNSEEFRKHYRVRDSSDKVVRLIVGREKEGD
jgi:site-specific recombinase XerD